MSNSSENRLEEIRKRINEIDQQLIELIAERTSFAPEIATLKKSLGTCVFDPKREEAICEKTRLMCQKHHIEPEVALKVMKILMDYNKEVQKTAFKGKLS